VNFLVKPISQQSQAEQTLVYAARQFLKISAGLTDEIDMHGAEVIRQPLGSPFYFIWPDHELTLEAFAVDDGRAALIILLLGDPHLLEGRE
jgi:hypothetical protein